MAGETAKDQADKPVSQSETHSAQPRQSATVVQLAGGAVAGVLVGSAIGWLSHLVGARFAPLVLFPLLVGLVLGAVVAGAMRVVGWGSYGNAWTMTTAAVLALLTTQHGLAYRDAVVRAVEDAKTYERAVQAFPEQVAGRIPTPPSDVVDFLRRQAQSGRPVGSYRLRGPAAWISWLIDGLIIWASASFVVVRGMRRPYCNRCRSWYTSVRSGRLEPAEAVDVARFVELDLAEPPPRAAYRVLACRSGCGPTGFELLWEDSAGRRIVAVAWLQPSQRSGLFERLDRATENCAANSKH